MDQATAIIIAQGISFAMKVYAEQGRIPTVEEIVENYKEIQAIIDAEKGK